MYVLPTLEVAEAVVTDLNVKPCWPVMISGTRPLRLYHGDGGLNFMDLVLSGRFLTC